MAAARQIGTDDNGQTIARVVWGLKEYSAFGVIVCGLIWNAARAELRIAALEKNDTRQDAIIEKYVYGPVGAAK